MIVFVGCSSNDGGNSADSPKQEEKAKTPDQVGGVSLENTIKVDKEAGTITVFLK